MSIFSCDTIVALGNSTKSGNVIFAKNSDRPVNEAQPLVICEAEDHQEGKMLQCTYIEIPQVRHTYRVIGSRPHWIWGFEHGMNEHKVIIGNEAVWSKEKVEEGNAFLGMDLLRLGLERGKTAYEAMHIIITLLEKYGQGGNCTYGKETYYHNSFIIADPGEAWILETVNRRWIAKRVKDAEGISNLYSITDKWEEASSDIKEHAYKMGWYDRTIPFNFAKAYSAMSDMVQIAYPRWKRLNQLLQREKGNITIDTMKAIQRDHYEGELIEPRFSPADGIQTTICVHSPGVDGTKTAAASVAELTKDTMPVWYHCFSNPCASVFIPCYLEGELRKS